MSDQQINILDINVSRLGLEEVLESVEKYLQKLETRNSKLETDEVKPLIIFTPNPEIVTYAQKDEEFKKIVNTAQINIPDGVGLILAGKILGKPFKQRISGVDLMEKLVEMAVKKSLTVGLIGGKEGVAVKALECLKKKYPGLKSWAEEGPLVETRNDYNFYNLYQKIRETKTSFLFVGLGAPKQEYFIANLCHSEASAEESHENQKKGWDPSLAFRMTTRPLVLMSVGGSFDYFSGKVKRAPVFIRKIGFEWAWRLVLQPWRIKRQLALVKFVWLVLKQKLVPTKSGLKNKNV